MFANFLVKEFQYEHSVCFGDFARFGPIHVFWKYHWLIMKQILEKISSVKYPFFEI